MQEMTINHPGIQEVKIREDKKIFATAGWDHRYLFQAFQSHNNFIYDRVRIYNWKKLTPLAILKSHTEGVYALAFSSMSTPGGSLLASASKDKKIALWSIYNK